MLFNDIKILAAVNQQWYVSINYKSQLESLRIALRTGGYNRKWHLLGTIRHMNNHQSTHVLFGNFIQQSDATETDCWTKNLGLVIHLFETSDENSEK